MSDAKWPPFLRFAPLRKSLNPRPPEVLEESDMEAGRRLRRKFSDAPWLYPITWPWSSDEFQLFRAWHRHTLHDGARWFAMPLWNGESYDEARCRFGRAGYDPKPSGVEWHVSAVLEVESLRLMTPAEARDRWPGCL